MTTLYLAAPWVYRDEARRVRRMLQDAGFEVNARWLDFSSDDPDATHSIAVLQQEAKHDVEDIQRADIFVVLNLAKSEGKATEQGMAYMLGTPIVVVGPHAPCNNIFQYLPGFVCVPYLYEAIPVIRRIARTLHGAPYPDDTDPEC